MRLTKVTVSGFKSFADTVDFRFDEPKVGIVGPNGCGKSNVVDAVKWVLGERSAKSLRGGAMLDVIFAGSAGRKPLGMASVTLTFANPITNPNARLPEDRRGLQVDMDEVAVSTQASATPRTASSNRAASRPSCKQAQSNAARFSKKPQGLLNSKCADSNRNASSNEPKSISFVYANNSTTPNVACEWFAGRQKRLAHSRISTISTARFGAIWPLTNSTNYKNA